MDVARTSKNAAQKYDRSRPGWNSTGRAAEIAKFRTAKSICAAAGHAFPAVDKRLMAMPMTTVCHSSMLEAYGQFSGSEGMCER
jgi:hypothetical protein